MKKFMGGSPLNYLASQQYCSFRVSWKAIRCGLTDVFNASYYKVAWPGGDPHRQLYPTHCRNFLGVCFLAGARRSQRHRPAYFMVKLSADDVSAGCLVASSDQSFEVGLQSFVRRFVVRV